MSGRQMMTTRTHLEMRDPGALRLAAAPKGACSITQITPCPPAVWRYLYTEVGRHHRWVDRLDWTDDQARAYLDDPAVSIWLLTVDAVSAGYFELRREPEGTVELAYFGLLAQFQGRGLGGYLLGSAVQQAWALGATHVRVHTSTLDHPAALPNYLNRGFQIVRVENCILNV